MKRFFLLLIILLGTFLNTLQSRDLKAILESGVIRIGFDKTEIGSINYKMAYAFADYMDLEVEEVMVDWEELFTKDGSRPINLETDSSISFTPDALINVDLYCGNVSPLEWRARLFDFAFTLISAEVVVTKNLPEKKLLDVSDLKNLRIAMMTGTSFVEHMKAINEKIGGSIILIESKTSAEAKKMLKESKVDGIVLDAPEALSFMAQNQGEYKIQIPITAAGNLAWAIEMNNPLKNEVANFMAFVKNNGELNQMFDLQYGITYEDFENMLQSHTPVKRDSRDLDQILKEKKIVVSFRERDFIYHKDGKKQFTKLLAEEFANYLGVELEYVIIPTFNDYWKTTEGVVVKDSSYTPEMFTHFDLACDIFAPLEWRKTKVDLIKVYESDYAILAKRGTLIRNIDDLRVLKGVTSKNTLYDELLKEKGLRNIIYTGINDMVPTVLTGKADYTLIYNAFLYPKLQSKLSLGTTDVSWAVRYDQPKLKIALEHFISESSKNGLLKALGSISKGEINTSIEDYLKVYYSASQKGTLPHIVVDANNGLPQEDVNCMYQDSKGFLWFGTRFGLVNYNGKSMKKYYSGNGLISNIIIDIAQMQDGNMLIATDKGLSVLSNNKIFNVAHSRSVNLIYQDSKQKVWLACEDGLAVFEDDIIKPIPTLKASILGAINSFQEDKIKGDFIIATSKGLFRFDGKKLKQILNEEIYFAFIDQEGDIWYTSPMGVFYVRKDKSFNEALQINKQTGIPNSPIRNIKEGFHGSIWLQNTHHLYQITSINQKAIQYTTGKDLINNVILSSLQDREQNLWIGYSGGLQKIRNNKSLRNFFPKELDYYISSISIDKLNNIWVTSNNGTFFYSDEMAQLLKKKEVHGFSIARQNAKGDVVVVNSKGLYSPDNQNNLKLNLKYNLSGLKGALVSSNGVLYVWTETGYLYEFTDFNTPAILIATQNKSVITNVIEFENKIYVAIHNEIFVINNHHLEKVYQHTAAISGIGHSNETVYLASRGKLFSLNAENPAFLIDETLEIKDIIPSQNRSFVWISTSKGVLYFNISTGQQLLNIAASDGLQGNEIVDNGIYIDKSGILWILTYHGISNYNLRSLTKVKYAPKCYLSSIVVNGEEVDSSRMDFAYNENDFAFSLSGIFFSNEKSIKYEYYLRGGKQSANFIRITKENTLYYDNLEDGDYVLVFRAKGEDDIWSESKSYKFAVNKAIWNTWWFRIFALLLTIGGVVGVYSWRLRRIRVQKQQLEELVEKRTEDLVEANKIVVEKNKEITSSIHYAERIQQSLLPKKRMFNKRFQDHFIIFMPRDIVSGDFFWAYEKKDRVYVSAVDCTGHGVPGAFMSMLGISFLKEIVNRQKNPSPGEMLNGLRNEVITALQQEGRLGETKDGMDMSLVSIDTKTLILEYAGANNSIYIIRQDKTELKVEPENRRRMRSDLLFEVQPDKMPIAIYDKMRDFTTVSVQLQKNDLVYLFSDGFPDQFGGPKNKKLMYPRLRKVLETNHDKTMEEQKFALMQLFNDWKGPEDQIDDVTLIGIRV